MTSHSQDFLGEEVQNQKPQASSCGVKFSLLQRVMELRYLNYFFFVIYIFGDSDYFILYTKL